MKNIFYKIFMLDLDPEPGLEIIRMMSSTLEKNKFFSGKKIFVQVNSNLILSYFFNILVKLFICQPEAEVFYNPFQLMFLYVTISVIIKES